MSPTTGRECGIELPVSDHGGNLYSLGAGNITASENEPLGVGRLSAPLLLFLAQGTALVESSEPTIFDEWIPFRRDGGKAPCRYVTVLAENQHLRHAVQLSVEAWQCWVLVLCSV